jgi:hypothetical protein
VHTRCLHFPDDRVCDDGDACTTDRCEIGTGCVTEPDPLCGQLSERRR